VSGFVTPANGAQVLTVVVNNSTFLTYNATTGQFTGTVAVQPGTSILTVAAVDQATQQQVGVATVIVVSDGTGPRLSVTSPANGTSTVVAAIAVQGTASAFTGVASVTLTNLAIPGSTVSSNSTSPIWSAVVQLVPSATNVIVVVATDNVGSSVSQTLVIVQTGLTPLLTCPADFAIECGSLMPNPAIRLDNCNAAIVAAPETFVAGCGGTKVVRKSFSACAAACFYSVTLVDTTPPTLVCPPDVTVACESVGALASAQATDACTPSPTVTVASQSPVCGSNYTRVFRANDGCGNTATCSQTVFVLAFGGSVTSSVPTTSPAPALSSGELGGLIAGVVLLLLLLLLCFLIALLWLRRRKKQREQFKEPIMMGDHWEEDMSSSTSTITRSKMYKPPANQSDDSTDLREIMSK
jgi:hypothetical protein